MNRTPNRQRGAARSRLRTGAAKAARWLLGKGVPALLALVLSVIIFDRLVMPRFVRHGSEVGVPNVVGEPLGRARLQLDEVGLAVRDTLMRASAEHEVGHVIEQDPRPGAQIKPERGVILVLSQGQRRQRVPAIQGQSLRFAMLTLNQDGYLLGDVIRVPSESAPRSFVISSDPPAGEMVPPGGRVHLLVSDGPEIESWIMPDLSGRELFLTADRLRFAGFPVQVRESDQPWGTGIERVHFTIPPPGSRITARDTIVVQGY